MKKISLILALALILTGCTTSNSDFEPSEANQYLSASVNHFSVGGVNEAIDNGADVNLGASETFDKGAPIMAAIEIGHDETIRALVENGADLTLETEKTNVTPLMYAIESNNQAAVNYFIENGADVNQTGYNKFGNSELNAYEVSLLYDYHYITKDLVDAGAEIRPEALQALIDGENIGKMLDQGHLIVTTLQEDGYDITEVDEITEAAMAGDSQTVNSELDKGSLNDENKPLVIDYTAAYGSPETMQKLMDMGYVSSTEGNSEHSDIIGQAAAYGNTEMLKFFESNGADLLITNSETSKNDYLTYSIATPMADENLETITYLVKEVGIDYSVDEETFYDFEGDASYRECARYCSAEEMKLLIDNARAPLSDNEIIYLINLSIQYDNEDVFKYLVSIANTLEPTNKEYSPLDVAVVYPYDDFYMKYLLENGADVNYEPEEVLPDVFEFRTYEDLKYLVDIGVHVDAIDSYLDTDELISTGEADKMQLLLDNGFVMETTSYGASPINVAAKGTSQAMFDLVLANSTTEDINLQDEDGNTALHKAILNENTRYVEDLLKAGADPTIMNNEGMSARDIAVEYEMTETVELIDEYLK